jgi:hypothetical protein
MSYNDKTDVEAVLQVPPTPPTATTRLTPGLTQAPGPVVVIPGAIAAPPTPVAVPSAAGGIVSASPLPAPSGPPLPIQTQRAAGGATAQSVPVAPTATQVIAPTTTTPLISDGVAATPQTPLTTTPGTVTQS